MEIVHILEPYFGNAVSLFFGGLATWWFQRKKDRVDLEKGIVDLYQDSLTDLKGRYQDKYDDLKSTYDEKFQVVQKEVEYLKQNLEDWKKRYFDLKRDFEKYKKEHP